MYFCAKEFVSCCRHAGLAAQCGSTLKAIAQTMQFPSFPASGSCGAQYALQQPLLAQPPPHYSSVVAPRPILAERIALPATAATTDLLSLLPPEWRQRYATPSNFLADFSCASAAAPAAPRVHGSRGEYVALLRRMLAKGMIGFTTEPKAINGLFAVEKDAASERLIVDARPANACFVPPPAVTLPTPSHMAALQLPAAQCASRAPPLVVAKLDLSNFYHQLRLPPAWCPYFALPPLDASEAAQLGVTAVPVYPMCLTLPMGFSHSVALAQAVHEHVLYSCGAVSKRDNILNLRSPVLERTVHALYIDDAALFDSDGQRLAVVYQRVLAAYARAGLALNTRKLVPPTTAPTEVLGILVEGEQGRLSLSPERLLALLQATAAVLQAGVVSGRVLGQLLGSWTWALLLRRPALSVLRHVYRFVQVAGPQSFALWPSVRRELVMLCGSVPHLSVQLSSGFWREVVATDACESGGAVTCTPLTPALAHVLVPATLGRASECVPVPPPAPQGPSPCSPDLAQPARSSAVAPRRSLALGSLRRLPAPACWRTPVAVPWRRREHINALELRALLLALRWLASRPSARGSRVVWLTDSAVAFYGVRKGRSSSPHLLHILRKIAALSLMARITLLPVWLPSKANPADRPSRWWELPPDYWDRAVPSHSDAAPTL
jgi:hypothetical protein